jgi:hypothetical protein
LFPSSVGIFASIKNLILQERDVHVFIDIATARTILLRWLEKDTVFYPSPTPKRQGKYRVLTIDGKCECGSDQGFSKEEWHFQPGTTWTQKSTTRNVQIATNIT